MKHFFLLAWIALSAQFSFSQNVGIGETNPPVKLTVKSTGLQPSLLVKNSNDDSVLFTSYLGVHFGGYHPSSNGIANISNKHFLPADAPQLDLVAAGERSGINANGSISTLKFSNVHSNKFFSWDSYAGNMATRNISLNFWDIAEPAVYGLLNIKENGQVGVGTYQPEGKFQINHRSSSTNPALVLMDSSTVNMPVMEMKNASGSGYWQIRGILATNDASNTYLDFATHQGLRMTLSGEGNLGIGTSSPVERFHVNGNSILNGNLHVSGEVTRQNSNNADLLPKCYGQVNSNGTLNNGSDNFAVEHPSAGLYEITIAGEPFHYALYTVVATPVAAATPIVITTSSLNNKLQIRTMTATGTLTNAIFNFIVYQQ